MTFAEQVTEVVRSIPAGTVLSYKAVAKAAGRPRAYRAVATMMAKNFDPTVPCHRVIQSSGRLGDYNRGGMETKQRLLKSEGVIIENYYVHL